MRDHVLSAGDATTDWPIAGDPPPLAAGEVHLWSLSLQPSADDLPRLTARLDAEERERAARFLFDPHRRRFVAGRAGLRAILSRYLGQLPEEIAFAYEGLGKPFLAKQADRSLQFNLSNSGELAVVAISADRPLGVDVEYVPRRCNFAALARRYFSPQEQAALFALPEEMHRAAFFRCWTRKEAMLKATGVGLTFPLDRFVVSLAAEESPRVVSIEGCAQRAAEWWLASFTPHADYEVALAMTGGSAKVRQMAWSER